MAPKRKRGTQRIDAAIDHFFPMGYTARQVRTAVNALLKVYYMDPNAWRVLEEDSYCVVQERLLEMEEEEKKLLEQEMQEEEEPEPEQEHPQQEPALDEVLLEQETQEEQQEPEQEQPQQLGPEPDEVPLLEQEEQEQEQEQPQQQEPAVDEVLPQSNSLMLEWHNMKPAGLESSDEEGKDPMLIKPHVLEIVGKDPMLIKPHVLEIVEPLAEAEALVPLAEATRTGKTRRPCYGWLSESEDEEEQTMSNISGSRLNS